MHIQIQKVICSEYPALCKQSGFKDIRYTKLGFGVANSINFMLKVYYPPTQ